jgi:hypothetical protein
VIPVFQTKYHGEGVRGNCMRGSLASVFEIAVEEIPEFEEMERTEWRPAFYAWLLSMGFDLIDSRVDPCLDDFYLAIGDAVAHDILHCVVYKNGKMVHDPHPVEPGKYDVPGIRNARRFWSFRPIAR